MADTLHSLFDALDTVVLERRPDGRFRCLTQAPDWLDVLAVRGSNGSVDIYGGSPFLDHFLDEDADTVWKNAIERPRRSGPWVESDQARREWPFEATALCHADRQLLLVRSLGEEYKLHLAHRQGAHESLLTQEALEKEVRRRTEQTRRREAEIAIRLITAASLRDDETGGHIRRIGLYAAAIARALGWSVRKVDEIRLAASMHDIGKIGIEDRILLKPGKLTDDERRVMERHAEIGAELLDGDTVLGHPTQLTEMGVVPLLAMAREIALCHHEHWDGSGYPRGLAGTEIPDAARITTVVDVYDAMVHERVYKPAIPEDRVVAYIKSQSGRHLDPDIVGVFLDLLPEIREIRLRVTDERGGGRAERARESAHRDGSR